VTRRGKGLLLAAAGAFVAARVLGVPQLHIAALAGLLLVAGTAVVVWSASTRLQVERTIAPGTIWAGESTTVTLTVRNLAPIPSAPAELHDRLPGSFGQRPRASLGAVAPTGRATVAYDVTGVHRGNVQIGPLQLSTADPFGLWSRRVTIPSTGSLTVYPTIHLLPPGLPLGGSTSSGQTRRTTTRSDGEDLADVREYVHGDDLRSVHWPSTAHRGKLMVRRSESAQAPRAVVLLDVRADRHAGVGAGASIETAVTAAASVSYHLATRGRALVLVDDAMTGPPRSLPWETAVSALADVQPRPADLGGAVRQLGQGVAGDGTLVAVVTTPDPTELRQLVHAGRGFATRVVLVVDAESHRTGVSDDAADTAVAALRAAGVRATVLRRGDRVDTRWPELFARPRTGATTPAAVAR
jgi:uncharacterized protein (DUF58 family)